MWHRFVLFFVCLTHLLLGKPHPYPKLDKEALLQLAMELGLPPHADLLTYIQKHWLRQAGQERWEMEELSPLQRECVLEWATAQKLFSPCRPIHLHYEQAVILGAATDTMQERLYYLKELWEQGVVFKKIVWLVGARQLDPLVENLACCCHTETDAARTIWEHTTLPEGMRALPVVFLDTPLQKEGSITRRPNTYDTLVTWKACYPPCRALFISSQPFCGYQGIVVESVLSDAYDFNVVGPGANPWLYPNAAAITLDSLARWLYQEAQTYQIKGIG